MRYSENFQGLFSCQTQERTKRIAVPDARGDETISDARVKRLVDRRQNCGHTCLVLADLCSGRIEQIPQVCFYSILLPVKPVSFVNEPSSGRDALFINRGVILEGGKNVDVFVSQGKRLRSSQVLGNNARELFEFHLSLTPKSLGP